MLVRVTFRGERKYLSTGTSAKVSEWDAESSQFNTKAGNESKVRKGAIQLNKKINGLLHDIEKFCTSQGAKFNLKTLELPKERVDDFELVMKGQIAQMEKDGQAGNAMVYNTALNRLKAFGKSLKTYKLNAKFMQDFDKWLDSRRVSPNTKSNYFRTIRAAFNKGIADGFIDDADYPFSRSQHETDKFRVSSIPTSSSPRGLKTPQLVALKGVDTAGNHLHFEAKAVFMLSFYFRGMNLADLVELKWKDIKNGRFQYVRKKTRRTRPTEFDVKIPEQAEPFLAYFRQFNREYVLPVLNGKETTEKQMLNKRRAYLKKINRALKDIGSELELSHKLTTYVARHGYTKISREGGAGIDTIREALGQKSLDDTATYLKALDTEDVDKTQENLP